MEIKKTSRHILVIDDEAVLKIVEEVLTNLKHNVTVCSSPKTGLSRFRKENFDIVITNMNMPEISGWEVAEKIKIAKAIIPIILLKGWTLNLEEQKIRENGIDYVLKKPFTEKELERVISKVEK